ncbi:MAG: hypothetical protein ACRCTN_07340, partial [Carnobacterium maltaromaticum]
ENRIATVALIHDFLTFNNSPSDAYYLIKDVKLYNPLYETAKKFVSVFPNRGPKYEQTKVTAFTLLGKMVLTGGDMVREIRDYLNNIVSSPVNDEFNDVIEESIEEIRDKLEVKPVKTAADYRQRLEEATPQLRQVTEMYSTIANRQNRGKNVNNFITDLKESLDILQDIQRGEGLTGNLMFDNFSKSQILEIRDIIIKINLISEDLIKVYDNEL